MSWPPTLPYPDWLDLVERTRIDEAVVNVHAVDDAAAVDAVVDLCAVMVAAFMRQRAHWPTDRTQVRRAAERVRDVLALRTFWRSDSVFADRVRARVAQMTWWQDLIAITSGTIAAPEPSDISSDTSSGPAAAKTPDLLTRQQAAKELGNVSLKTIDRMLQDGKLARVKVRGAVRVRRDSVDRVKERHPNKYPYR